MRLNTVFISLAPFFNTLQFTGMQKYKCTKNWDYDQKYKCALLCTKALCMKFKNCEMAWINI